MSSRWCALILEHHQRIDTPFVLDIRCRLWEYTGLSFNSISDWRLHIFSAVLLEVTPGLCTYVDYCCMFLFISSLSRLQMRIYIRLCSLCSAIWRRNKKDTRAWVRKCERDGVSQGAEKKPNGWTWHGDLHLSRIFIVLAYERRNQVAIVLMREKGGQCQPP